MVSRFFSLQNKGTAFLLRLQSADGTNRLTRECVLSLTEEVRRLASENRAVVLAGSDRFFSVGAELEEISALDGSTAYEFSKAGQELMEAIDCFPGAVYAAVSGYCMGGGLDLALACHYRIASPQAVFGHRGAALGLITGWGGTQRLPRLVGRGRALEMFIAAEEVTATPALQMGLVDAIADDPVAEALRRIGDRAERISPEAGT
jgi:enoyl-CoA hydratase/carnithine racemase